MSQNSQIYPVVVIGAGPAGLTTAYTLAKAGYSVIVLEKDPRYVGGISKTIEYKGFGFDIGGHRFFSKTQEIEDLWTELLPNGFMVRRRSSRMYYRGKYFSYPLKPLEAFLKLGLIESAHCAVSYVIAKLNPKKNIRTVEDWVTNQFGKRLFQIFFETYTEKVWGMKCSQINADWAAQRIKGLSLLTLLRNAVTPKIFLKTRKARVKSLIESFRYPQRGPGQLWEAAVTKILALNGKVLMGTWTTQISSLVFADGKSGFSIKAKNVKGEAIEIQAGHVVSTTSIRELFQQLNPPPQALESAMSLRYRDFISVCLIVPDNGLFPDQWIYIHEPSVKVGRIQNFKNWSPYLVPDPQMMSLGLEYFCQEGDEIWKLTDQEMIQLATRELEFLHLIQTGAKLDGCVVRQPKAYPVYDELYSKHIQQVQKEMSAYPNLHLAGRNGMHKYNNQDHAMMTGLLTAKNIIAEKTVYSVWNVNQDAEYTEEATVET